MSKPSIYEQDLDKNPANYVPLSPLSWLARCAHVYPDRTALIHGDLRQDWATTFRRSRQLASALSKRGIRKGDTVAVMAPNVPALYEAHFGVPMCGAVLNALNIRLDAAAIRFILEHGEAKVLITDREFSDTIREALDGLTPAPLVIDIDDPLGRSGERLSDIEYETFVAEGDADYPYALPDDEWDAISLNYTSGTTGNPKGVVYHHRGAYLNGMGNVLAWALPKDTVYLWTLPMFHCNGWCFPWTLAAIGGTNVCLRRVDADNIFDAIEKEQVTHLCGAPIVMGMMVNSARAASVRFDHPVQMMTAGAAPPADILRRMDNLGVDVTHAYGLTEVYGPCTSCEPQADWADQDDDQRARLKARQGVAYATQEAFFVANPETLDAVPHDGETMGELMFRGNTTMKGYLKNPTATRAAFEGGMFHTGDLGVTHPDGYIEIRDRSKDIIISGGENISSIEVENALFRHPAVGGAAVVARPDERWGETPCAFVELREGASADEAELIAHCREELASYKCPKTVVFGELPKTSTGKIQKFVLRDRAAALG